MYRTILIAAFSLLASQTTYSQEREPLECPQCGVWTVSWASPAGATGENIVVSSDQVSIPTCGKFRIEQVEKTASVQSKRWTYQVTLLLRPIQPEVLCGGNTGKALKLGVAVSVGYIADGGLGEFGVYEEEGGKPVFSATAWNYSRDHPCYSGSAIGSIACLNAVNARLIKELAFESYYNGGAFRHGFNAARFASRVMEFCETRAANSGGGKWPSVWARDCQSGHLQTKLSEIRKWDSCRVTSKSKACKPIDESFDKSPKEEQ